MDVERVIDDRVRAADRPLAIAVAAKVRRVHAVAVCQASAVRSHERAWSRVPWTRISGGFEPHRPRRRSGGEALGRVVARLGRHAPERSTAPPAARIWSPLEHQAARGTQPAAPLDTRPLLPFFCHTGPKRNRATFSSGALMVRRLVHASRAGGLHAYLFTVSMLILPVIAACGGSPTGKTVPQGSAAAANGTPTIPGAGTPNDASLSPTLTMPSAASSPRSTISTRSSSSPTPTRCSC